MYARAPTHTARTSVEPAHPPSPHASWCAGACRKLPPTSHAIRLQIVRHSSDVWMLDAHVNEIAIPSPAAISGEGLARARAATGETLAAEGSCMGLPPQ